MEGKKSGYVEQMVNELVNVKIKFTLEQATKAQRGNRGTLYSFFNFGARWRWVFSATSRPLYPRE
jgi:hypothetical protein